MPDSPEQLTFLNDLIVTRHAELARMANTLDRESRARSRLANRLKVALITLGAFSASQAVVLELAGSFTVVTSAVFAVVGITIAMIAGIETAFKFEARSSELRLLGAKCQAARFQHNSEWAYKIAIADVENAIAAARDLLAIQDRTLSEVQLEAAKLGVSLLRVGAIQEDTPLDYFGDVEVLLERWDKDLHGAHSDLPPPDRDSRRNRGSRRSRLRGGDVA